MKRTTKWTVLIAATLLVVAVPGYATVIVYDPTNHGTNLEQVGKHREVNERLDEQIQNQQLMLKNWRFTRLDELVESMNNVHGSLEGVAGLDLAAQYPVSAETYAQRDAIAMKDLRNQWLKSHRAAVVLARGAQNRVVGEMPNTHRRLSEFLERSSDASGQTAALQASNETIVSVAAQLQYLQALELAESRVELEEEARHQADAAFHRQRCAKLMRDWPSVEAVNDEEEDPIQRLFGKRK